MIGEFFCKTSLKLFKKSTFSTSNIFSPSAMFLTFPLTIFIKLFSKTSLESNLTSSKASPFSSTIKHLSPSHQITSDFLSWIFISTKLGNFFSMEMLFIFLKL
ncbi:MAG TPA: hypothetical protein DEA27_00210 [Candidatus Moranbacteria bacterium]|nr:hypothetical protein [Candidatus Moranbacteria bacterium]